MILTTAVNIYISYKCISLDSLEIYEYFKTNQLDLITDSKYINYITLVQYIRQALMLL